MVLVLKSIQVIVGLDVFPGSANQAIPAYRMKKLLKPTSPRFEPSFYRNKSRWCEAQTALKVSVIQKASNFLDGLAASNISTGQLIKFFGWVSLLKESVALAYQNILTRQLTEISGPASYQNIRTCQLTNISGRASLPKYPDMLAYQNTRKCQLTKIS